MVFPSDFSLSGMFGCHIAWPNMGGNFFAWFLGARKILGEFSPPKVPPMSGPTCWPFRLPHGARKRLLGGPGVNFYFAFYDQLTRHTNRCCCHPACPVFKTACVTTTQTCFPFRTLKQSPPPSTPNLGGAQSGILFVFFVPTFGRSPPHPRPPLKRNPWSPGGATNPWDAGGDERRTDSGGLSRAWPTVAFPQNELIFFLFSASPLSLLPPLLVVNPAWG